MLTSDYAHLLFFHIFLCVLSLSLSLPFGECNWTIEWRPAKHKLRKLYYQIHKNSNLAPKTSNMGIFKNVAGTDMQYRKIGFITFICAGMVHITFFLAFQHLIARYWFHYLTCMFLLSPLSLLVRLYCLGQLQYCLHFQLPTMNIKQRVSTFIHIFWKYLMHACTIYSRATNDNG